MCKEIHRSRSSLDEAGKAAIRLRGLTPKYMTPWGDTCSGVMFLRFYEDLYTAYLTKTDILPEQLIAYPANNES